MDDLSGSGLPSHLFNYRKAADRILTLQTDDGSIPWFEEGPWDPWNHTEAAMALTAMGHLKAARTAYEYLRATQRADGAWYGEYGNALPMVDQDHIAREAAPQVLDSNFCAYPAAGIAHYVLQTRDMDWLRQHWPMVKAAIDFVLRLQRSDGTITWSLEAVGTVDDDALLAGNASIAKSLECAIWLAAQVGEDRPDWQQAYRALITALADHPERFDRRGQGARFAMDWYYPVLSGALDQRAGAARLETGWDTFVAPGLGCRCVADEPWVTVAETCELAIALVATEQGDRARSILQRLDQMCDSDGAYWMGWQFEEQTFWPKETPSWTQAAVILAADAAYGQSAASRLLTCSILQAPQQA